MKEQRRAERVKPIEQILVKEDTGEVINYYYLKDISETGMYLLRKIANDNATGKRSSFTFMTPDLMEYTVEGILGETRLNSGEEVYGTAVQFVPQEQDKLKDIVEFIKTEMANKTIH